MSRWIRANSLLGPRWADNTDAHDGTVKLRRPDAVEAPDTLLQPCGPTMAGSRCMTAEAIWKLRPSPPSSSGNQDPARGVLLEPKRNVAQFRLIQICVKDVDCIVT